MNHEKNSQKLKVSIQTFGCQMNFYDSEVAGGLLEHAGFEVVAEPENNLKEHTSDVVLMNTCSVREHAEERVYGRLGMLGKAKEKNPDLIIGLMGCMVEEHREKLFKRFPYLDLMVGTRNIKDLPVLIEEVRQNREQVSKIKQDGISIEYTDQIKRYGTHHAWLPVMTGCNKVCTYCIVPITRGSEVSMPAREVYREASRLVGEGVQWITLLGQNVNSYQGEESQETVIARSVATRQSTDHEIASAILGSMPRKDGKSIGFPQLLEMLCKIEGLKRISFTTSHPHDATEELFQVIAKNQKISRRFHLPLQSGSNRMLKRMKRLHTYEEYKGKIDRLRELVPDIGVTTDIIAGFSGETDQDHADTRRALEEIRFDGAYIYKYSIRPGTPAANLPDDVPKAVKEARNVELFKLQKEISRGLSRNWIGREVEIFVDGESEKEKDCLIGRTDQDRRAVFPASTSLIGKWIQVKLTELRNDTFRAEYIPS